MKSKGEHHVKTWLEEHNINYRQEISFGDLISNSGTTLKFDFGVYDNNWDLKGLIEYNGIQHYNPIDFFGGEERLQQQQVYDKKKKEYSFKHSIPLLVIRYDEDVANSLSSFLFQSQ